jgi:hypothetical protein
MAELPACAGEPGLGEAGDDGLASEAPTGPVEGFTLGEAAAGDGAEAVGAAEAGAAGDGSTGDGSDRAIPESGRDDSSLDRVKKKIAAAAASRRRRKAIGRGRSFMIGGF